jgi:glycosyltransferase involved in cell wall biosynthesis
MASLIPFADEYLVMDFGSTDDTLDILESLAKANPKIRILHRTIKENEKNNRIFATMANELVSACRNELVLYHQADEIWHEDLLEMMRGDLEALERCRVSSPNDYATWRGMNFWRYQLKHNFQAMKWWPHPVNRLDFKHRLQFVEDGMNTNRPGDPQFVGGLDGGWGPKWQTEYQHAPHTLPTNRMILDVGMIGGFLDSIPARRRHHAPFWGESPEVIYIDGHGVSLEGWYWEQKANPEWIQTTSKFNLPAIARGMVGQPWYRPRVDVLDRIARG